MSKYLILYATREGQTKKIAHKIAQHLVDNGIEVDVYNAKNSDLIALESYDTIICGGSMHAGGVEKELVDYVNLNSALVKAKPNAFFLVLLSAATKDPQLKEEWLKDAKNKLFEQINFEFNHLEMIAGALKYSKYAWPMKWVMRKIAKKAGEGTDINKDYEYTDWKQVKAFSDSLFKVK